MTKVKIMLHCCVFFFNSVLFLLCGHFTLSKVCGEYVLYVAILNFAAMEIKGMYECN